MPTDALVISPFRRPTFRKAISADYPMDEVWDSAALSVAGALERAGLEVGYLALQNLFDGFDEEMDMPRLRLVLDRQSPSVVLFSSDCFVASRSTATLPGIRIVSRELAVRRDRPWIGMTGRLATTARGRLFDLVEELDFLLVGEPELIVGDAVTALIDTGVDAMASQCPSALTRDDPQRPAEPAFVADLDTPALPAFHLLETSLVESARSRNAAQGALPFSVRTSAGCRFQCRFCAGVPFWRSYRRKSAMRVGDEIDRLHATAGVRGRLSFLEDEVFTLDAGHVEAVSRELSARSVKLDGVYTHSSMLTPGVAANLAPITRSVFLGVDAASDAAMRAMRKGQTVDLVIDAIHVATGAGLGVHLEWLLGSPEDDVDALITALNAIFNLLSTGSVRTINTYIFCPHPGTDYAVSAAAHELEVIDGFDEMQESGGYPASRTAALTRAQVYAAYLMSQIVIGEALRARESLGHVSTVRGPSRGELRRLFERMADT